VYPGKHERVEKLVKNFAKAQAARPNLDFLMGD
jgi:hypothetical protein